MPCPGKMPLQGLSLWGSWTLAVAQPPARVRGKSRVGGYPRWGRCFCVGSVRLLFRVCGGLCGAHDQSSHGLGTRHSLGLREAFQLNPHARADPDTHDLSQALCVLLLVCHEPRLRVVILLASNFSIVYEFCGIRRPKEHGLHKTRMIQLRNESQSPICPPENVVATKITNNAIFL